MSNLQIFINSEFGQIRAIKIDGKPFVVGVDVARALEYAKPSQAVIDHCKGIRKLGIPSPGGIQETNVIPEGDIYRLIIKAADQSKNSGIKIKAEKFEKWIFDEVLLSISKHGAYLTPQKIEEVLLNPDTIIQLATALKEERQKRLELEPKAEYFDNLIDRENLLNFRDTAKEIHVKPTFFIAWLLKNKYVYRERRSDQVMPYSQYVPEFFEIKEYLAPNGHTGVQALVTVKGRQEFLGQLRKEGALCLAR